MEFHEFAICLRGYTIFLQKDRSSLSKSQNLPAYLTTISSSLPIYSIFPILNTLEDAYRDPASSQKFPALQKLF
jgi:hypothetical protein